MVPDVLQSNTLGSFMAPLPAKASVQSVLSMLTKRSSSVNAFPLMKSWTVPTVLGAADRSMGDYRVFVVYEYVGQMLGQMSVIL